MYFAINSTGTIYVINTQTGNKELSVIVNDRASFLNTLRMDKTVMIYYIAKLSEL